MNERLAKAEAVFHEALEVPPEQRESFLQRACGHDAELRAEVAALLRASGIADQWLRDDPSVVDKISEGPGTVIGRYKLREKVGEGGCGVVYVAEQEEPVRRRVALKIIKLGMDTRSVVARFEAERQALAMMDHPNIAKVLDAGTTDTGRPYFVMELVRGIKITEYCDQHKVSTRERLELFIKVCQAVQHAHQKGIIHRDLKPSNILVTLHDGVPVPKVIDFGIAKATEGRLTEATVYTQLHQFIGTPAYMSPEQAEMSGLDIDTRSDIYSLGVLLYELLTGVTPFDAQTLVESGLDEMRRIIREEEPKRPSTRLSTLEVAAAAALTKHRQEKLPALVNLVRGDLDWIVMKCLEKDRARRYETANGLGADVGRHLAQEPVTACPPGPAYRFGKFVRRNKFTFAAGTAVAVALIAGLAMALLALARERAANERAEQQRRLAEQRLMAAVHRLESVLTNDVVEVWGLPGSTPVLEGMLRDTVAFMEALAPARTDHPEFLLASAKIHARLAWSQANKWGASLGNPEAALASASNAWRLLQAIPVNAIPAPRLREATFWAEEASGMALEAMGREEEAPEHYRRMLQLAEELDAESPRSGKSRWSSEARLRILGFHILKSQFDLAREENAHLLRDPFLLTNTASTDLDRLAFTELALGIEGQCYMSVSNWVPALDYLRKALTFCEAYLAQSYHQHIEYHAARHVWKIGETLCAQRNYFEGIRTFDEACRRQEALVNRDKETWLFQGLLTDMRLGGARQRIAASKQAGLPLDERLRLLEEARDLFKRSLDWMQGPSSSTGIKSWGKAKPGDFARELSALETDLGWTYRRAGRLDDAEAIYRERLGRAESSLTAMLNLGELLLERAKTNTADRALAQEQKSEGEQLLRKLREEVLALRRKVNGPEHAATLQAMHALANSFFDAGHREEALKLREDVLALRRKVNGLEHTETLWAINNLAISYFDTGRREEALKLREELLALRRKLLGWEHPETTYAMNWLAISYFDAGRREEALKLREEVLPLSRKVNGAEHNETLVTMNNLAISYFDAGRRGEALKLREELLALRRKVLGPEHAHTIATMGALAISYFDAGRREEALKLREEVLALRRKVNGPDHADTLRAMIDLAEFQWRRGDFAAAESLYREVLQSRRARLDAEHKDVISANSSLARLLADWAWAERTNSVAADVSRLNSESPKDPSLVTSAATAPLKRAREAERLLRDTLAIFLRGTNASHWRTHDVRSRLGFALVALAETDSTLGADARQAKLIEAETLLRDSNHELQRRTSVERKYKRDAVERLVRLYEAWGKPDKVSEWRQKLKTFGNIGEKPSVSVAEEEQ